MAFKPTLRKSCEWQKRLLFVCFSHSRCVSLLRLPASPVLKGSRRVDQPRKATSPKVLQLTHTHAPSVLLPSNTQRSSVVPDELLNNERRPSKTLLLLFDKLWIQVGVWRLLFRTSGPDRCAWAACLTMSACVVCLTRVCFKTCIRFRGANKKKHAFPDLPFLAVPYCYFNKKRL